MRQDREEARQGNFATLSGKLKNPRFLQVLTRAAGSMVKPERMVATVLTYLQLNPAVLDCTPASIIKGCIDAAAMGLEPNGLLGMGYLLPFSKRHKNKDGQWETILEAHFIAGYQGLIDLAYRGGKVRTIMTAVVYARDRFRYMVGMERVELEHEPWGWTEDALVETKGPDGKILKPSPGPMLGAYARVELVGGGVVVEPMTARAIAEVRETSNAVITARAKAAERNRVPEGPWFDHPEAMWRKTALRQLFKWLPRSAAVDLALEGEAAAEAGVLLDDLPNEIRDLAEEPTDGPVTVEGQVEKKTQAPMQGLDRALGPATPNPLAGLAAVATPEPVPVQKASPPPPAAPLPLQEDPRVELDEVLARVWADTGKLPASVPVSLDPDRIRTMNVGRASEILAAVRAELAAGGER